MLWSVPFAMVAVADARAAMPHPAEILAQARRVADWQVAHRDMLIAGRPTASDPRDWQQATFWVAMTDLADLLNPSSIPVSGTGENRVGDAVLYVNCLTDPREKSIKSRISLPESGVAQKDVL